MCLLSCCGLLWDGLVQPQQQFVVLGGDVAGEKTKDLPVGQAAGQCRIEAPGEYATRQISRAQGTFARMHSMKIAFPSECPRTCAFAQGLLDRFQQKHTMLWSETVKLVLSLSSESIINSTCFSAIRGTKLESMETIAANFSPCRFRPAQSIRNVQFGIAAGAAMNFKRINPNFKACEILQSMERIINPLQRKNEMQFL